MELEPLRTLSDKNVLDELIAAIQRNFKHEKFFAIEVKSFNYKRTVAYYDDLHGNMSTMQLSRYLRVKFNEYHDFPSVGVRTCCVNIFDNETYDQAYTRLIRVINNFRKKIRQE